MNSRPSMGNTLKRVQGQPAQAGFVRVAEGFSPAGSVFAYAIMAQRLSVCMLL
jgi:hypothetical protein